MDLRRFMAGSGIPLDMRLFIVYSILCGMKVSKHRVNFLMNMNHYSSTYGTLIQTQNPAFFGIVHPLRGRNTQSTYFISKLILL